MTGVQVAMIVIGSGGLASLFVALVKVRPEANQILVASGQDAVKTLQVVIDELREDNHDLRSQLDECKKGMARLEDVEHELAQEKRSNSDLSKEVNRLKKLVNRLAGGSE